MYNWYASYTALSRISAGLSGRDVIHRSSGIGFLLDYDSYFDNRTKQLQSEGQQGLEAFHEWVDVQLCFPRCQFACYLVSSAV